MDIHKTADERRKPRLKILNLQDTVDLISRLNTNFLIDLIPDCLLIGISLIVWLALDKNDFSPSNKCLTPNTFTTYVWSYMFIRSVWFVVKVILAVLVNACKKRGFIESLEMSKKNY